MPRLNIETELWSDARFQKLMLKLGQRHLAMGAVVDFWTLAQKFWWPDRRLIPETAWKEAELPEALIECGLAERRPEGIYAKGAEEHFRWWFDRQAAGRKGGLASQSERRKTNPCSSVDQAKVSKFEQTEASSSAYGSSSTSEIKEENLVRRQGRRTDYTDAFEDIYQAYPRKEGKVLGYEEYLKLSPEEREQLAIAVKNYARQCRTEKREIKHIRLFSTFMADEFWKDHISSSVPASPWDHENWEVLKPINQFCTGAARAAESSASGPSAATINPTKVVGNSEAL